MALSRLPSKPKSLTSPPVGHLFSSSSSSQSPPPNDQSAPEISASSHSDPPPPPPPQQPRQPQPQNPSFSSDLKASLRQRLQQHLQEPGQRNAQTTTTTTNWNFRANPSSKITSFAKPVSKAASLEEIKKNLSEFRLRSSVPPPTGPNSAPQISFSEIYQRNLQLKSQDGQTSPSKPATDAVHLSFEKIRESLRQMPRKTEDSKPADGTAMSPFRTSLRLRPTDQSESAKSTVIGGTGELPVAIFGKEMKRDDGTVEGEMSTEFVTAYGYSELGEKLRKFRPEAKDRGKGWFSLEELNERLRKLREEDVKEKKSTWKIGGVSFWELRQSLKGLKMSDEQKAKKNSLQGLNVLGPLTTTPNFMLHPPKDSLVEQYFHRDNMSSSEKLKIELAKVRDEFKMSESDCGSARVQVAQLTTKIKHLALVLHKKDKHSRKGLQAMTQKRKKLLKYLRRTDWDSYCFVISKLGLQDNPSHKTKLKVGN